LKLEGFGLVNPVKVTTLLGGLFLLDVLYMFLNRNGRCYPI